MSHKTSRRSHVVGLGLNDQLDVDRVRRGGHLVHFSLNHRTWIVTGWKEVIRYDTHHGRLHVNRFWRKDKNQVGFLEQEAGNIEDYENQSQEAEKDTRENWEKYRRILREKT